MTHAMFKNIVALNTYTQPFLSTKANEQREIIEQCGLSCHFDMITPQKHLKIDDFELGLGILLDQMDMSTKKTACLDLLKHVSVASSRLFIHDGDDVELKRLFQSLKILM